MATDEEPLDPGRRDVEKRWSDPRPYRAPTVYALAVIVLALVVLAVFAALGGDNRGLALAVPGVFLLGGIGALGTGIAVYTRGKPWVPWQGAGWFLLVLMLGALTVPYAAW
ncbi:hypothetical protein MYK68_06920 [Gordonia sp. PP30]|uniref:hypothetical protein n=1 Tax=Gordonia sp. PP30 TaxID=2935861 RepID=UPI001FFEECC3|nr:hypothetical protein [Gordonia sp. PP30]UQE76307.1 hypothetical protein MYK68_06920 [Gordonia sp. PP30]